MLVMMLIFVMMTAIIIARIARRIVLRVGLIILCVRRILLRVALKLLRRIADCRTLDDFIQFAAIEPDAATPLTIINLDALTLGHRQGYVTYRTVHNYSLNSFFNNRFIAQV